MKMNRSAIFLALLSGLLIFALTPAHIVLAQCPADGSIGSAPFWPPVATYSGGAEPSGIVWHPILNRYLVVSDDGILVSMDAQGGDLTSYPLGGDIEGVTLADPASLKIYIAVENPPAFREYQLQPQGAPQLLRTFNLNFVADFISAATNQRLEAITFVPDASQAENWLGGYFYIGLQANGCIYPFTIEAQGVSATYYPNRKICPGYSDIAALSFDTYNQLLYAVFDGPNRLLQMDAVGVTLNNWALAGNEQEGLAILNNCRMAIAQDTGGICAWGFNPFGPDVSSEACNHPVCGNGVIEEGEGCDDANYYDLDDCSNSCRSIATATPTASATASATATPTATATTTATASPTASATLTATGTASLTPTPTATSTATFSTTPANTASPTARPPHIPTEAPTAASTPGNDPTQRPDPPLPPPAEETIAPQPTKEATATPPNPERKKIMQRCIQRIRKRKPHTTIGQARLLCRKRLGT